VVHLEIGEPDFETAPHIKDAAVAALAEGQTHYGPSAGLLPVRESIARYVSRTRGLPVTADQVVVTPGAKPILFFTILALCEEGDEVVYPDPGFPMYESIAAMAGATPVPVPLREENGFRVDPDELASLVTDRTRLVVLNSPHNPCGSALTRSDIEALAAVLAGRDVYVLSDEVYWAIRYEGAHESIAEVDGMRDRTILLDGCSKTFAMTGWRLGFAVLPEPLVEPVTRLVINAVSCTAPFTQMAAVAALTGPWDPVDEMVAEFGRRRDVIVSGLNAIDGITCVEPGGAFYVFPNVSRIGVPSKELATFLLDRAGVATLWGEAFGGRGAGYLRLSYANSVDNIRGALEAIEAALPEVRG
jgi:aspartate aminotransferase